MAFNGREAGELRPPQFCNDQRTRRQLGKIFLIKFFEHLYIVGVIDNHQPSATFSRAEVPLNYFLQILVYSSSAANLEQRSDEDAIRDYVSWHQIHANSDEWGAHFAEDPRAYCTVVSIELVGVMPSWLKNTMTCQHLG